MSQLTVEKIGHRFGQTDVLKNISFALERGELLSILGASGSGKQPFCVPLPVSSPLKKAESASEMFRCMPKATTSFPRRNETSGWCFRTIRCFRT